MLSFETFKRMANLSKKIEENEITDLYKNISSNNEPNNTVLDNYYMVKVNIPGTNNYHFELRKLN